MSGKKRTAVAVAQEEEAFPRGGGSGLAPIVHRQIKEVSIFHNISLIV